MLMPTELFTTPWAVSGLEDCAFYHFMDLPGWGVVRGAWDLRGSVDEYLGHQDFVGKRVLEIGPASGFLTFEMERRGANVVSVEIADDPGWDWVPYPKTLLDPIKRAQPELMRLMKNGYWLAHRAYGSRALVHYGDAYNLPAALGEFDIAVIANVLLHTHSPLQIIEQCAARARAVVIVDMLFADLEGAPICRLAPTPKIEGWGTWWQFSSDLFGQFLAVMGWQDIIKTTHIHDYHDEMGQRPFPHFTLTARRS